MVPPVQFPMQAEALDKQKICRWTEALRLLVGSCSGAESSVTTPDALLQAVQDKTPLVVHALLWSNNALREAQSRHDDRAAREEDVSRPLMGMFVRSSDQAQEHGEQEEENNDLFPKHAPEKNAASSEESPSKTRRRPFASKAVKRKRKPERGRSSLRGVDDESLKPALGKGEPGRKRRSMKRDFG